MVWWRCLTHRRVSCNTARLTDNLQACLLSAICCLHACDGWYSVHILRLYTWPPAQDLCLGAAYVPDTIAHVYTVRATTSTRAVQRKRERVCVPPRAQIDLGQAYQAQAEGGLDYALQAMACYGSRHYLAFVCGGDGQGWTLCDDFDVVTVGGWDSVLRMCRERRYTPTMLLYARRGPVQPL